MSPTIMKIGKYRFFFFSREEPRKHIHIISQDGEAKFWLEPEIELAKNFKFKRRELKEIEKLIEDNYDKIIRAWEEYFTKS